MCSITLVTALVSGACASVGPGKLVSSHTAYNDAVQLAVTREVLANIVRSRYADPMQFMAVSAINAQFSVSVGASADVGGIGQETAGGAAGSIGYSDSPTITFVPQSDAAFYKSFYGLFDVSETVGLGLGYRFARSDSDWQALRLRFSFATINGASDFVGGRSNAEYEARIDALVRLFELGAHFRQIPEWDFDTMVIPRWRVRAEDMVAAFRMGFNFVAEEDGKNVRLARYRLVLSLVLPAPDDPEATRALEQVGVVPGRSEYVFRPPLHAGPGEYDPYSIWVTPRSIGDMINLATRIVDVPEEHADIVPSLAPLAGERATFGVLRIRSSRDEPPFPYRVRHRGYWFYVDDASIDSKIFLEAMVAAYTARVGSVEAGGETPQVVLPVGGG
jgi:hypothetical protein